MRPKLITVFCTALFLVQGFALFGAIISFFIVIDEEFFKTLNNNPLVEGLTVNSALYGIVVNAFMLVAVYGLWIMKKWSVYLFTLIFIVGLVVIYVIQPAWIVSSEQSWWLPLIIPSVYYGVVAKNWRLLDEKK